MRPGCVPVCHGGGRGGERERGQELFARGRMEARACMMDGAGVVTRGGQAGGHVTAGIEIRKSFSAFLFTLPA